MQNLHKTVSVDGVHSSSLYIILTLLGYSTKQEFSFSPVPLHLLQFHCLVSLQLLDLPNRLLNLPPRVTPSSVSLFRFSILNADTDYHAQYPTFLTTQRKDLLPGSIPFKGQLRNNYFHSHTNRYLIFISYN